MANRRNFLKNALTISAGSVMFKLVGNNIPQEYLKDNQRSQKPLVNPFNISQDKVDWVKEATMKQLKGCRVKGAGGTWIHTPDGVGNYKALWTRDSYYMVEYAGDLMDPEEIKGSIYYLINGQREDGCIPDRVNAAGLPVYLSLIHI